MLAVVIDLMLKPGRLHLANIRNAVIGAVHSLAIGRGQVAVSKLVGVLLNQFFFEEIVFPSFLCINILVILVLFATLVNLKAYFVLVDELNLIFLLPRLAAA